MLRAALLSALAAAAAGAGVPDVQVGKFTPEYLGGAEYYYDVSAPPRGAAPASRSARPPAASRRARAGLTRAARPRPFRRRTRTWRARCPSSSRVTTRT